jgi:pilus assembly protein CpaB
MEGTMGRRSVLLVAALVVAALGTTMVLLYVNGVNDRALAKQSPVRVQIAKNLIEPGTSVADAIAAGDFASKTISRADAIDKAISELAEIKGLAANSTIYPGDQITPAKFGVQQSRSTVPIPANTLGVSVELSDPAQDAGFVSPGSHVAIFLTSPVGKNGGGTRVLLPDVEVLAVGDKTTVPADTSANRGTETNQVSRSILTLAVDQADYQRVVYARTHGELSLALLGKGSTPSQDFPTTNDSNLFP